MGGLLSFDLIGGDLLAAIRQTWLDGYGLKISNVTYIILIPKCEVPTTFADFRPISLCNLIYKVVSKIISDRLKPLLVDVISGEQFGFLKNR